MSTQVCGEHGHEFLKVAAAQCTGNMPVASELFSSAPCSPLLTYPTAAQWAGRFCCLDSWFALNFLVSILTEHVFCIHSLSASASQPLLHTGRAEV